jgi:hypothetical protein
MIHSGGCPYLRTRIQSPDALCSNRVRDAFRTGSCCLDGEFNYGAIQARSFQASGTTNGVGSQLSSLSLTIVVSAIETTASRYRRFHSSRSITARPSQLIVDGVGCVFLDQTFHFPDLIHHRQCWATAYRLRIKPLPRIPSGM